VTSADRPAEPSTTPYAAADRARARALQVARDWDEARTSALLAGDVPRLRELYRPGSGLARQDVDLLRRYAGRGVRLRSMARQVLAVDVHVSSPRAVALTLVERLVAVRAQVDGLERTLPTPALTTHRLHFERVDGRWRLSSVRGG
jgi:hypothetical protein